MRLIFRPQYWSQVIFDPQFGMPPDTKTKLISIQTLKQVIFDPHKKPSQFWSLHWNQVNSDPPHWNHVYFDHPHNIQVNFDANTKTMYFSGRVTLRVMHTGKCFCGTAAIMYTPEYIITSTNSYYSWRFHTTVKPRKKRVYTIFRCLLHGIYTTTCDTGGRTLLRSILPVRSTFWRYS